jgi:hypothetical protein
MASLRRVAAVGAMLLALGLPGSPATAHQTENQVAATTGAGTQIAFQAKNHKLTVIDTLGEVDVYGKMPAGSSPSLVMFPQPDGSADYRVAYQNSAGNLATVNEAGGSQVYPLPMAHETSPSLTALPGGDQRIAYRSSTGNVLVVSPNGSYIDFGPSMAATSPSLAAFPDGTWRVAYQSPSGELYVGSQDGSKVDYELSIKASTDPSIVTFPDGQYRVAVENPSDRLSVIGVSYFAQYSASMIPGSSPSITALPNDDYRVGFLNTQPRGKHGERDRAELPTDYDLWVVGPGYSKHWWLGMRTDSSPSMGSQGSYYEGAFQSSASTLWVMDEHSSHGSRRKVAVGTNPSIGVW